MIVYFYLHNHPSISTTFSVIRVNWQLHGCRSTIPRVTNTVHSQRVIDHSSPEPEFPVWHSHSTHCCFPLDRIQFCHPGVLLWAIPSVLADEIMAGSV